MKKDLVHFHQEYLAANQYFIKLLIQFKYHHHITGMLTKLVASPMFKNLLSKIENLDINFPHWGKGLPLCIYLTG